jgi:hypothetical protein
VIYQGSSNTIEVESQHMANQMDEIDIVDDTDFLGFKPQKRRNEANPLTLDQLIIS